MSARSEKPKNRRVRLVGGGYRWTRGNSASRGAKSGGSIKAIRRGLRKQIKDKRNVTPEVRKALQTQLREMLVRKA